MVTMATIPGYGRHDVFIFQAALLCVECGNAARERIRTTSEMDSDVYPQGPYANGGGEADSPQHCDHCNTFLHNPLTGDGYAYVAERILEYVDTGRGNRAVLTEWAEYYGLAAPP